MLGNQALEPDEVNLPHQLQGSTICESCLFPECIICNQRHEIGLFHIRLASRYKPVSGTVDRPVDPGQLILRSTFDPVLPV